MVRMNVQHNKQRKTFAQIAPSSTRWKICRSSHILWSQHKVWKEDTLVVQFDEDDMIWRHFAHVWPFLRGIAWPPVTKSQWYVALIFALISCWTHTRAVRGLRRRCTHVTSLSYIKLLGLFCIICHSLVNMLIRIGVRNLPECRLNCKPNLYIYIYIYIFSNEIKQ